jgi:hypothetical protein
VLLAVTVLVATAAAGFGPIAGSTVWAAPAATVPAPPDDAPVVTANPFIPENVDLTTCVGTLPRPGCGSEERGGLHQNLVAVAMIAGLLIVFGRVAWGVRRNRQRSEAGPSPDPSTGPATP